MHLLQVRQLAPQLLYVHVPTCMPVPGVDTHGRGKGKHVGDCDNTTVLSADRRQSLSNYI